MNQIIYSRKFSSFINSFYQSVILTLLLAAVIGLVVKFTEYPNLSYEQIFSLILGDPRFWLGYIFLAAVITNDRMTETLDITTNDASGVLNKLNIELSQFGYNLNTKTDILYNYKPSFKAGFFPQITISILENRITVVGPRKYMKKLSKISI